MVVFFSILLFIYCLGLIIMMVGWIWPSRQKNVIIDKKFPVISVIIPVRNEKENIFLLLEDLIHQDYPLDFFEVIVVDDQSDDGTFELISSAITRYCFTLRLYRLPPLDVVVSTKKKAIQLGVEEARGEYIVTTDGDCRVFSKWLSSYGRLFVDREINFAAGMVTFSGAQGFFQKLQVVEFAVLTGIGASTMRLGMPTMCNAANMAFKKQAYEELGGFNNVEHIISGDDGFLLEKFKNLDKHKIHFLKNKNAIVATNPQKTILEFYHQRKRWASKWKFHKNSSVAIMALFVFLFHACFLFALGMTVAGSYSVELFLLQIFIKAIFDFAFLQIIYLYLGKKLNFAIFVSLEAIYPFYAVFFGFAANLGGFSWKGRKYGLQFGIR